MSKGNSPAGAPRTCKRLFPVKEAGRRGVREGGLSLWWCNVLILAVFARRFPAHPALWAHLGSVDPTVGLSQVPPSPNFPATGTALDQGAGNPTASIQQGHWGPTVYGKPSSLAQNSAASKWPQRKSSSTVSYTSHCGRPRSTREGCLLSSARPVLTTSPVPWHPMEPFSLMPPERWEEVEWVCYLPLQNRDTLCLRNISILPWTGSLSHAL